jgi:GR25 family glycosyltransferase involved in LPS biosynthesis
MSDVSRNKIIFIPSGRLGNAIFRYMACAIVNIINPRLEYTLAADSPSTPTFTYYKGVDQEGNDAYQAQQTDKEAMHVEAIRDHSIVGYNTLGYFKHTIDLQQLTSNKYINNENGQGLYIKTTLTLTDANFFDMFYKKLEYFHVRMEGYFQFGYIYLKYKPQLLHYMNAHKDTHYIQTDLNERILMREILDDLVLPLEKQYDMAIHIRLGDFNGRPDFIECEHYLNLFASLLPRMAEKKICIVYQASGAGASASGAGASASGAADASYITTCLDWFQSYAIPVQLESNSLLIDFNIMKQAKLLVCSMSTLAWAAAYLSAGQQCYMPDYNFYGTERQAFFFHKPTPTTILYPVKTSPAIHIQPYILTLPEFASRINKLDGLNLQLSRIGLDTTIYHGVHGKDVSIYEALSKQTHIKHVTWQNTTYFYDTRVRINGVPMSQGEFGCAWSHLNLLRKLVDDRETNYYLILEDDVELVKPVGELQQLLQHLPPDTDLCHLAKSDWNPFVKTNPVNAYFYECAKLFFNKTTSYVISKKGAQKILDYTMNSINMPIDDLFNTVFRLTPDFRFYVPGTYFFKEQDNVPSSIKAIDQR